MAALAEDAGPGDRRRTVLSGNHTYTCEENALVADAPGTAWDESVVDRAKPIRAPKHNGCREERMRFPFSSPIHSAEPLLPLSA